MSKTLHILAAANNTPTKIAVLKRRYFVTKFFLQLVEDLLALA